MHSHTWQIPGRGTTDYEAELGRIDGAIAQLEAASPGTPAPIETGTRFVYGLYQRASLTGSFAELERVLSVIEDVFREIGAQPDLCLLKANVDLKFHRLRAAKACLELVPELTESLPARALKADIALQEGDYEGAMRQYESLIDEGPTWDILARLAHLKGSLGDLEGADRLYTEAEDEITAKEMREYAWVELERGTLRSSHGDHAGAWACYRRADNALSGYWLVGEHIAELLGAEGRLDEAAELYREFVTMVPKPELQHALGDVYVRAGQPELAEPWYAGALAAYMESVERGGVHYFHHLAAFFADVRQDGDEAVRWARRDLDLRRNAETLRTLAWAQYRAGQFDESLASIHEALSTGVRHSDLLTQAKTIHIAAAATCVPPPCGEGREGVLTVRSPPSAGPGGEAV